MRSSRSWVPNRILNKFCWLPTVRPSTRIRSLTIVPRWYAAPAPIPMWALSELLTNRRLVRSSLTVSILTATVVHRPVQGHSGGGVIGFSEHKLTTGRPLFTKTVSCPVIWNIPPISLMKARIVQGKSNIEYIIYSVSINYVFYVTFGSNGRPTE